MKCEEDFWRGFTRSAHRCDRGAHRRAGRHRGRAGGNPPSEQCTASTSAEVAAFQKRAAKVEGDAADALAAATKAKGKNEAETAKAGAVKAKSAADALSGDIQKWLDSNPKNDDTRICADQQQARANAAAKKADEAVRIAQDKIDEKPTPPAGKAEIFVVPDSLGRGEVIGVGVFCPKGKIGDFSSDVLDFIPESRFEEKNVVGIAGIVKKDATAGKHTVTSSCDGEKLTASFTVTAAPPVEAKKPTAADTRRKVVVKPKGKIETGGGATAVATV
ncbi:hypothetical protein GCM10029964_118520 [Kibdelosporangium lantanae]